MFHFKNKETPLPRNRIDLIKDTIKYRFFELMLLSVYTILFMVPSLIRLIFSSYLFDGSDVHTIYEIALINFVNVLFITFWGLGFAGLFYCLKRISFQEGEDINKDFFIGIKKNYKMFLLVFFIIGIFYAFLEVSVYMLGTFNLTTLAIGALQGILYALFFILLIPLFFVLIQSVLYIGTFRNFLLNGIKFLVWKILSNIGIFLLILIPFFIFEFVPSINGIEYFQYAILIFEGLFYFAFSFLCFILYSNSLFDLTINKNYPEMIRKGLAKEKDK